jgi:SAM-dependent methyltransferase
MRVNLGCGSQAEAGWLNIDAVDQPGVDIVHDLDHFPWPVGNQEADEIRAWDVFEHVDDPCGFMSEAWRILRPGGLLFIHTNYWDTKQSFRDPTHKRFCTEDTFDYWIPGTHEYERYGAGYSRGQLHNSILAGVKSGFARVRILKDGQELSVYLGRDFIDFGSKVTDDVIMPWER